MVLRLKIGLPAALVVMSRGRFAGVVLAQLVDAELSARVVQLVVERNGGDQKAVRSGHGGEGVPGDGGVHIGAEGGVRSVVFVVFPGLFCKTVDGVHGLSAFGGAHVLFVCGVYGGDHNSKHTRGNSDFNQSEALGQFHCFSRLVGIMEV